MPVPVAGWCRSDICAAGGASFAAYSCRRMRVRRSGNFTFRLPDSDIEPGSRGLRRRWGRAAGVGCGKIHVNDEKTRKTLQFQKTSYICTPNSRGFPDGCSGTAGPTGCSAVRLAQPALGAGGHRFESCYPDDTALGRRCYDGGESSRMTYFCSGCSAVRLARQLRELEVPGSNPGIPTMQRLLDHRSGSLDFCRRQCADTQPVEKHRRDDVATSSRRQSLIAAMLL